MIDFWPLIGVAVITIGLALRLNALLVILLAGVVTGLVANLSIMEILDTIGKSFTKNRYMSLFILILPMIGVSERFGLRQRAEDIISSIKNASVGKVLMVYLILRKVTNTFGLQLGGHPSMIRPLVSPMAEAAATKEANCIDENEKERIKALSAASENFGNFFSQLIFIGAGGLLLIKGVFSDNSYEMKLSEMFIWAIPTGIASIIVFYLYVKIEDIRLMRKQKNKKSVKVEG